KARLWDARTGKPLGAPLQHQGRASGVAFSPDGGTILTWGNEMGNQSRSARLWCLATREPLGPLMEHGGGVYIAGFSPDGTRVITGCQDGTIRFWDAATGKPLGDPFKQDRATVIAVAFSPDGRLFVTGTWSGGRGWETLT